MPKDKQQKQYSVDTLRHAEYYDMQGVFDDLYTRSQKGEVFTNISDIILSRNNILLAYRNLKTNSGSNTPGTDGLTINDIGKLSSEIVVNKVQYIVQNNQRGYHPRPVRRKEIPKPNGSTRPLGIPCIWDRLIQQCIKQVMEPICEAKFSDNSYGFRPNRSVENAIDRTYRLLQISHLHYVIEFDIKGFFDNVNHSKLIRQIWAMGIQDKHLIYIIKRILKAPMRMPDGSMVLPQKGTPQGGIISPLLANIVLNELDHWAESQWQSNPVTRKHSIGYNKNGSEILSHGFAAMRKTNLKEMFIVRYADDFRIFCRSKSVAQRVMISVTQWLRERLRLEVSQEKTRIVNTRNCYSEFLGFKIKVRKRGKKYTVVSHISDKLLQRERQKLVLQAKRVAEPVDGRTEVDELRIFNAMVMGIQNYYCIATMVNRDCNTLHRAVMTVFTNRLRIHKQGRLRRQGRKLTPAEWKRYKNTKMMRYLAGTKEPIYPIGYIQHKNPMAKKRSICSYTAEGRKGLHDNLRVNTKLMHALMSQSCRYRTAEYADNRISLFSAQWGKCAVTGREFQVVSDIHCHHIIPRILGGTDAYGNLVLVLTPVHRLIHATQKAVIDYYMRLLNLSTFQLAKVNMLRIKAGLSQI